LIGLTKNTGAFYASKGIRCNVVAAGSMATNIGSTLATEGVNMEGMGVMTSHCKCAYMYRMNSLTVISMLMQVSLLDPDMSGKKYCDVNKIAEIVLFLCSDAAQVVNGAVWTADAGVTAY
jgi:NAD(P)-dependent dehydrogenase (short-subunit alcohol dehydrogenase family)